MLMGAFAGFIGSYFTGNIFIGLLLAVSGPAMMAILMAFLSVNLRTNQLVAGLAIWLLGTGLTALLYRLIFGVVTIAPKINEIPAIDIPVLSHLPVIGPILFNYDPMVYLAFLLVPLIHIFLFKTNLGLKIRTVGENPRQADALGVNVYKIRYLSVITGGVLAGIGGFILCVGNDRQLSREHYCWARLDSTCCGNIWQVEAILCGNRSLDFWNGGFFSNRTSVYRDRLTTTISINVAVYFTNSHYGRNV